MTPPTTTERRSRRPWIYLPAGVAALIAGFPLYWMVDTALSSRAELYAGVQPLFPHLSNLGELRQAMSGIPALGMLRNSFFIAAGTTVVTVLLGLLTGYALSRFRFHGRGTIAFLLFATQMVPEGVFLIPIYTLFLGMGLVNQLWALVLVNAAFALPVSTFIIKTGIDQIPVELEEAARVDNSPRLAVLTSIVVPLVSPSIASAAVLSFFAGWGEYMFASTFINSQDKWPATVGLSILVDQPSVALPAVMMTAILFSAPPIAFFILVQRHIVSGLTAGAVKG